MAGRDDLPLFFPATPLGVRIDFLSMEFVYMVFGRYSLGEFEPLDGNLPSFPLALLAV